MAYFYIERVQWSGGVQASDLPLFLSLCVGV
jgi:hypothetical protein